MRRALALLLFACGGRVSVSDAGPAVDANGDGAFDPGLVDGGLVLTPCTISVDFRPSEMDWLHVADIQAKAVTKVKDGLYSFICAGNGNGGYYYQVYFDDFPRELGTRSMFTKLLINLNARESDGSEGTCALTLTREGKRGADVTLEGSFDCPSFPVQSGTYKLSGTFTLVLP